jgi:DNA-binding NarL/FixJ family response regulator
MRVVVQERRSLLREGIAEILDTESDGVEILGLAAGGEDVVRIALAVEPDLVVLELEPVGWDAPTAIHTIRSSFPDCRFAVLHEGRRGEMSPLASEVAPVTLVPYGAGRAALRALVRGEVLPPPVARERRVLPERHRLSEREREVLRHIAAGRTSAEISELLGLQPKTIDGHKQRIFNKLSVQNQAHAVAVAYRMGVLGLPPVEGTG